MLNKRGHIPTIVFVLGSLGLFIYALLAFSATHERADDLFKDSSITIETIYYKERFVTAVATRALNTCSNLGEDLRECLKKETALYDTQDGMYGDFFSKVRNDLFDYSEDSFIVRDVVFSADSGPAQGKKIFTVYVGK